MRNNNIYISDLLSVHAPKNATSREEYLRQLALRKIAWSLLPWLGQLLVALASCGLLFLGIMMFSMGVGG